MRDGFRYSIEEVREAADGTSFDEIGHNETSRMISFRNQSGRINVYYATGTVGTCLNHPTRGRTQLFRRNVSLELLRLIFEDLRIHSGKGYYRKSAAQSWKGFEKDITGEPSVQVDSARRWEYVALATGLCTSESEVKAIARFCTSWDSKYWDPSEEPWLSRTHFSCGSKKALTNMLLVAACSLFEFRVKGVSRSADKEDIVGGGLCCNIGEFLEVHGRDVIRMQRQLMGFRKSVQIELMRWFFSRDHCGYFLAGDDLKPIETEYSERVDRAHEDYAELAYTKKACLKMCTLHGVMWDKE